MTMILKKNSKLKTFSSSTKEHNSHLRIVNSAMSDCRLAHLQYSQGPNNQFRSSTVHISEIRKIPNLTFEFNHRNLQP